MELKKCLFFPSFIVGNYFSIKTIGDFCGKRHLSNRLNPKMNNFMAFDYSGSEWYNDTDMLVPRYSAEFPRFSNNYQSKKSN